MHTLSELRMYGRKALTGKWVPAALVVFVATLLGANNSINLNVSYTSPDKIADQLSNLDANLPPATYNELTLWFFIMGIALSLVAIVVGSVLRIGLSKYFIDLQDGKEVSFKTITEPFAKQYIQAVVAKLLVNVATIIGIILFIVPGIMLYYGLSLVPYLMADDPTLSAIDAMKKSWELMRGQKFRLFALNFSFIGWMFIAVLLFFAIVPIFVVATYMESTTAAFYLEVVGANLEKDGVVEVEIVQ